jgi:hypothetical protein
VRRSPNPGPKSNPGNPKPKPKRWIAVKDTTDLDRLAKMFGIPTQEDLDEGSQDYYADFEHEVRQQALADGESEAEADATAEKALHKEQRHQYVKYHSAVMGVVEDLFEKHGLTLVGKGRSSEPFEFKIVPTTSWNDAADKIRRTINGVGMFEFGSLKDFLESGPYTAREAVLSHLGHIASYPEVYGTASPRRQFDSSMG